MRTFSVGLVVWTFGIFVVLCGLLVNARPAPPEKRAEVEYANAYKSLMLAYRESGIKIMSGALPPKSAPKAEKRAAVIKQVQDLAAMNHQFALRLKRLHPPLAYREIQATTEYLFTVSELGNLRWAQAIRSGNRKAQHHAVQESETSELKALVKMQQALKRAGGISPELNSVINEYQRDVKSH